MWRSMLALVLLVLLACGCGKSADPDAGKAPDTQTPDGTTDPDDGQTNDAGGRSYGAVGNDAGDTIAGSVASPATDRSSASSQGEADLAEAAADSDGSVESAAETPAKIADELVAEATRANDVEAAEAALKQAIEQDPLHRDALTMLGRMNHVRGVQSVRRGDREGGYQMFIAAADYLRQLKDTYPDLQEEERRLVVNVMYNAACAHSLNGDGEKALGAIRDAFDAGFDGLSQLEKDEDLAFLRDMSEFQTLKEEHLERLRVEAAAEAKELLAKAESFPFDFTLNSLGDQPVSLADLRGKIAIIDFWGTWCGPCQAEIPHFVELREKYQAEGLQVVGINYARDGQGEPDDIVKNFVAANNVTYRCLIGDRATRQQVPDLRSFPTTLFIDRAGKVRAKIVGYHELIKLEAIVTELLAEPAPPPGEAQAEPASDQEAAAEGEGDAPAGEAAIEAEDKVE